MLEGASEKVPNQAVASCLQQRSFPYPPYCCLVVSVAHTLSKWLYWSIQSAGHELDCLLLSANCGQYHDGGSLTKLDSLKRLGERKRAMHAGNRLHGWNERTRRDEGGWAFHMQLRDMHECIPTHDRTRRAGCRKTQKQSEHSDPLC